MTPRRPRWFAPLPLLTAAGYVLSLLLVVGHACPAFAQGPEPYEPQLPPTLQWAPDFQVEPAWSWAKPSMDLVGYDTRTGRTQYVFVAAGDLLFYDSRIREFVPYCIEEQAWPAGADQILQVSDSQFVLYNRQSGQVWVVYRPLNVICWAAARGGSRP